jgi:D-alanyl-D-alanine carboxypeptidase/D-alanyl-D-alanine-endopeptidase (penicillin-binding protein 4)
MPGPITQVMLAWTILAPVATAWSAAGLADDVKDAIRAAQLKSAAVAVSIRDADSDLELVSISGERTMIPASNMKLLTTGAALHILGPEFEFTTRLLRDGDRLIVVGDGDPGFGDPELLALMVHDGRDGMDVEEFLNLWVDAVKRDGITKVSEVVVDDRIFDRDFIPAGWPGDQLNLAYCAQTAGLNFHMNVLHFFPRPVKGSPPNISELRPRAPWLSPLNRATSRVGPDDNNTAWIGRVPDGNKLTVYGNVRFAYKAPVAVTVHDPPEFFAHLLTGRLREAKISVAGFRTAVIADPAAAGNVLGPVVHTPISTVLTRCNRDSENLYAEALLKRIGAAVTRQPGTWLNGATVLRHVIHERLKNPQLAARLVPADGSGLSRMNEVAPSLMTAWLDTFHRDERLGPPLLASMAVGGASGTLERRFSSADLQGATVHAKTGYINQVCCLSGFVTMPDGRRRTFSVMVNDLDQPGAVAKAKRMQEAIVVAVAKDMAAATMRLGSD